MKLKKIINELSLEPLYLASSEVEVKGGYAGDLLSNVMAGAKKGDIWVTIQGHQNIIAVSLLVDVAAVIVAQNMEVEERAVNKAEEKGINLLHSSMDVFEIAGKLYELGVGRENG